MQPLGYLLVDHRASPGLTEDQAKKFNYDPKLVSEGKLFEADTRTCAHCGTVVILKMDRTRPRGHCLTCNNYICDLCDAARHSPDYKHKTLTDILEVAAHQGEMKNNG